MGLIALVMLIPWVESDDSTIKSTLQRLGAVLTTQDNLPNRPIVGVNLNHSKTTDRELQIIKGCKTISTLLLRETRITDAGVKELRQLVNLRTWNPKPFASTNNEFVPDKYLGASLVGIRSPCLCYFRPAGTWR